MAVIPPLRWRMSAAILCICALQFSSARHLSGDVSVPIDPLPPLWPSSFLAEFDEENFFAAFTLKTSGTYFYDSVNNRERIDRKNGVGDRYCGSALPFRRVPCSHLVINGERYLIFEKLKYCCRCCDSASGCGVLRRDWLGNGTYVGEDEIQKQVCYKWNKPGLQNNFYWQAVDGTPMRMYMEPNNQITFRHDTFNETADFPASTFDLPTHFSCSGQCVGVCDIAQRSNVNAASAS